MRILSLFYLAHILLFVLLFAGGSLFGEETTLQKRYAPLFGEEQTSYILSVHLGGDYAELDSVAYIKDTLIWGKEYKLFNYYSLGGWIPYRSYCLRANEDNSKVYCFIPGSDTEEEILIFDLTLEKGDSYIMPYYNEDLYGVHEYRVDSVYTDEKGRKNIRMVNFYVDHDYKWFIEGEGDTSGFFHHKQFKYMSGAETSLLMCGMKDNRLTYCYWEEFSLEDKEKPLYFALGGDYLFFEPHCTKESSWGAIENAKSDNGFMFYPNPADEQITIETQAALSDDVFRLQLSDLQGRLCLERPDVILPYRLPVGAISSGLYIIRLFSSDNKEIFSQVLMVK